MAIVFKSLTTCEHRHISIHSWMCVHSSVWSLCMSCSGHFLLDRSQREQLSMRVTQMIDSLLCGGQRGHLSTGTFTLETPQFSSTIYILHPPPNQKPSVSVSFSLQAYRRNRKRCKATSFSKTNKQHNTTEPPQKPWNGLSVFKHPHSFLYFSLLFSTSPVLWSKL